MRSSLPFTLILLLALSGYFGYLLYTEEIPCVSPITYSLKVYDERFNLSKATIEADMRRAAKVWNDALGEELLVEASGEAQLPVIFSYGELQKTLVSLHTIEQDIDSAKAEQTEILKQYTALKKQFDEANKRGRATQEMADELNALARKYNALRTDINADVAAGNDLPLGESEAGLYVSDKEGTRVYVYGFENEKELLSTLTHEFGHALGLNHVEGQNSVMYPTDKSISLSLSQADLAELKRACTETRESLAGRAYTLTKPALTFARPYIEQVKAKLAK